MIAWRKQVLFLCIHGLIVGAGLLLPLSRGEALFGLGVVPGLWGLFVVAGLPVASAATLGVMLLRKCNTAKLLNGMVFVSLSVLISILLVLAGT